MDRAFKYLDQAFAEDPGNLVYLRADPTADSLKDDPRFAELIEEAGPRVGSGLTSADAVRDGAVPSGPPLHLAPPRS